MIVNPMSTPSLSKALASLTRETVRYKTYSPCFTTHLTFFFPSVLNDAINAKTFTGQKRRRLKVKHFPSL